MTSASSPHRDPCPPDYVAFHARRTPTRLAAIELAQAWSLTYEQLEGAISRTVSVLRARGCGRGDRVSVFSKNHVDLIVLHLACARLGLIFAPLNTRLSARELALQLDEAAPRLRVGDERISDRPPEDLTLGALRAEVDAAAPGLAEPVDPHAPSLLLFTSGTTGRPKGALLSERNLSETAINFSTQGQVSRDSRFLCDAPMFHVIGLVNNVRPALMLGGACAVSSGFEPGQTLRRLADPELGVTHYFCVPQMLAALRQHPEYAPRTLANLTAVFTGGAPHPAPAIRAALEEGITVVDGYGMTEVGCIFGMPLDRDLIARHAGAVGMPTPRVHTRIVDAQGRDCGPGETGELWVRGDTVFQGYFSRPGETQAAFDDGWFRTGDLFQVDANGYHTLVDRKKDMFVSGGENVYPAEIEAQLAELAHIAEAAVVGVADATFGEVGHLVFVARSGAQVAPEDILAHLQTRLARYKIPKHVSQAAALPRTPSGKLDKVVLRARLQAERD